MVGSEYDVALITESRYVSTCADPDDWYRQNILQDDRLLQEALARLGIQACRVDWASEEVDWSEFRCAVFRSTWDYFDRFDEFRAWLDRVERATSLLNDIRLIRWNMDKHYLLDLQEQGIPIVPSYFLEQGTALDLAQLLPQLGWDRAVIKPCISGAARHTYQLASDSIRQQEPLLRQLVEQESFILQPFQTEITRTGEDTLMVFQGRYTHAVRKTPKAGDFRVQDDHGGKVHPYEPTPDQIELAERAIAACKPLPIYGRVDMVRDDCGNSVIMELELIEPELWLRFFPPAATQFAAGIAATLM